MWLDETRVAGADDARVDADIEVASEFFKFRGGRCQVTRSGELLQQQEQCWCYTGRAAAAAGGGGGGN